MAFNMFAKLTFNAPGVEQKINSIKKSFSSLKSSAGTVGTGLSNVGEGVRGLALATAPIGIAMGSTVKEAGLFEQSLSAVQSILRVNKTEMKKLADTTKFLGATTIFTSSEVNRGAQLFAQAGFTIEETMAGLPGVLDAAAAGEISVAQATNLVASNVKAFSLEASEASRVADIMAETAALTNTNMLELGEGLKLSAAKAKGLGFTLSQTASAIGVISNVGVKGTLAGTALRNAFQKLSKPSKIVQEEFGQLGVIVEDASGKLLPLSEIFTRLNQAIGTNKSSLEGARKAVELFGIRGEVAFGAFREQAGKKFLVTADNVDRLRAGLAKTNSTMKASSIQVGKFIPNLIALDFLISESEGAANRMAQVRLDNFLGQVKLLSSAFNNLQIEVGSLLLEDLGDVAKTVTEALSVLSLGFRSLSMKPEDIARFTDLLNVQGNRFVEFIPMAQEFAAGFKEGFKEVTDAVKTAFNFIKEKFLEFQATTGLSAKDVGRFAAKFILIGAIAAPLFIALAASMFIVGQLARGLLGIFQVFTGVFRILRASASILFNGLRIGFTAIGVAAKAGLLIGLIKIIAIIAVLTLLWVNFKDKFIATGKAIFSFFEPVIEKFQQRFSQLFGGDLGTFDLEKIKTIFVDAFNIIKNVVGGVIDFILPFVEGISFVFAQVLDGVVDIVFDFADTVKELWSDVFGELKTTFESIAPDIMQIFSDIGDIIAEVFGIEDMVSFKEGVETAFLFLGAMVKPIMDGIIFIFKFGFKIIAGIVTLFVRAFAFGLRSLISIARSVISFIRDLFTGEGTFVASVKEIFTNLKNFILETFAIFQQGTIEGGFFAGIEKAAIFVKDRLVETFVNMVPKILAIITTLISRVKKKFKEIPSTVANFAETKFRQFLDIEISKGATPEEIQAAKKDRTETSGAVKAAADANSTANRSKAVSGGAGDDGVLATLKKILNSDKEKKEKPIIVNSKLECDGQVLARAVSKANGENSERQGVPSNCFKRSLVDRAPTGTDGGGI